MFGIIMEGALFVALIATVAALLFYALLRWTPLGLRLRQDKNRRQIEHTLELECPIHGLQREEEMVRLPSGSRICPVATRRPYMSSLNASDSSGLANLARLAALGAARPTGS